LTKRQKAAFRGRLLEKKNEKHYRGANRTIAVPLNPDSTPIMGQREGLQKSTIISSTRHTKRNTARTMAH
jgi:hypothetical protein